MKIGLINFGGGEQTLGLDIIAERMEEEGYHPEYINLDNRINVNDYDVLCVSIFWWEHKYDYIRFLKLAGIDPKKKKPLLILGGLEMLNPLPIAPFFNYAVMGDGEDTIIPLLKAIEKKEEIDIEGVFDAENPQRKIKILSAEHINPRQYIDLRTSKQTRIEIARGCKQKCKFCLMSWVKPYREVSGESLRTLIHTARTKNIALFCADKGSHSEYNNIMAWCKKYSKRNTGSDLRLDVAATHNQIDTLRFGIEGFSHRVRSQIGKNYSNDQMLGYFDHIFNTVKTSKGNNLTTATAYMIYGLPGEKTSDIDEFIDFLKRLDEIAKYKFTLFLTFNTFAPYFFTPLQWAGVDLRTDWAGTFKSKKPFLKNIVIAEHGGFRKIGTQLRHLLTLRGDERAYKAIYHIATTKGIEKALDDKSGMKIFEAIMRKCGIKIAEIYEEIPENRPLPTDMITNTVSKAALYRMYKNYMAKTNG